MGMSKLQESLKKLSFLGDYSSLTVPIILAVIGGLLFIPTILMQSKLKAEIESESIQDKGKKVESYLRQEELSASQWQEEKNYQDAYAKDAEEIAVLAELSGQRELLRYNLFPAPPNEVSRYTYDDFGNRFRSGIEQMILSLRGRDCPTQAELNQHLKKPTVYTPYGIAAERTEELGETEKIIVDALCRNIADSIRVYVNLSDISGYDFWKGYQYRGRTEAVGDCWYWQLGCWIIEDVLATVKKLNQDSENVFTSPVKRIVSVSFSATEQRTSAMPMTDISRGGERPRYVTTLKDGLTVPLTARKCDEDIDVVHFKVVFVIDSKATTELFRELCSAKEHKFFGLRGNEQERTFQHNQITILNNSYETISPDDEGHEYYRYGENAVVKVELLCEYIFNRKGYDNIKPESVQKMLEESLQSASGTLDTAFPTMPTQQKPDENKDDLLYDLR